MRRAIRFLLASAGLMLAGCVSIGCVSHHHHSHHPHHPHGMPPGQAKRVVHVHGVDCGHCYVDGVWVEIPLGHVHHDGCGHYVVNGVWHASPGKGRGRKR